MKIILLSLLTLTLVACCPDPLIRTEYVNVEIPVAVDFEKAPIKTPVELIKLKASDNKNYDKITKSVLINAVTRDNKIDELETLLDGYR